MLFLISLLPARVRENGGLHSLRLLISPLDGLGARTQSHSTELPTRRSTLQARVVETEKLVSPPKKG